MADIYKLQMRDYINNKAEIMYSELKCKPNFDIAALLRVQFDIDFIPVEVKKKDKFGVKVKIEEETQTITMLYDRDLVLTQPDVRFSIAHELGHLLLHIPQKEIDLEDKVHIFLRENYYANKELNTEYIEWEAEEFAAAFLMPKKVFISTFRQLWNEEKSIEENIHLLADTFGVPYKSILVRAKSIGFIY